MAAAATGSAAEVVAIVPATAVPENRQAADRSEPSSFLKKLVDFVDIVFLLSVFDFGYKCVVAVVAEWDFSPPYPIWILQDS